MKNTGLLMLFVTAGLLLRSVEPARTASFTVQMTSSLTCSPSSLSIAAGDTVTWTNLFSFAHTSTSGNAPTSDGLWNSGDVPSHGVFSFTFTNFAANTYPYFCIHHYTFGMTGTLTITNSPNVPPSVAITNPVAGSKFSAPANIGLVVSASDTNGSVTNVQFFSGASLLGSLANPPFNFTLSNAPAGNYSFTAKAVDNQGAATTSAVVNVFVLTNATLTSPIRLTNGQFQFTILGIAGQTYAAEASTNLTAWSAISTNVAPSNSFNVVDPSATNIGQRFYRARQDLF